MNFLRQVALVMLSAGLVVGLIGLALALSFLASAGNQAVVKRTLDQSGVYQSIVPSLLAQDQTVHTSVGDFSTDNPVIKAAAAQALPASQLQADGNQIIDSIFAWLNGKAAAPNFNIHLNGAQESFASDLANKVQSRAANLPTCTSLSDLTAQLNSATCLPPGVSASGLASQVHNEVLNNSGLINRDQLTAQDIKTSDSNQSIFKDQLAHLPQDYQSMKRAPLYLGMLSLVSAIGILLLSSTRRRGLKRLGFIASLIGLIVILSAAIILAIANSFKLPSFASNGIITNNELAGVGRGLARAFGHDYLLFGLAYLAAGALILAAERWLPIYKERALDRSVTKVEV